MRIYERIKERRKELHLAAEEVAAALGVSRATVYRYESADIEKLPITIIEPLAKVLKVSPAYLMGWENPSPAAEQPDHPAVGAAKPELSDRAYMVGRAYEDSDYLTQRMVERTLGIEEEAELKEPAGRQAFTA